MLVLFGGFAAAAVR